MFQLGWQILARDSYPRESSQVPDLARFDALVKGRLAHLRETADPAQDPGAGIAGMQALITNWTDAVRHYDSARASGPSAAAADHNRRTTLIYLKRLAELIQDDKQQTEQSLPQPQPGEGTPQAGDDHPKDPKDGDQGDHQQGPKPPGDKGQPKDKPQQGSEQKPGDPSDQAGDKKNDKKGDKENDQGKTEPGESPEQRARRILKENADLERGPLTPGKREFIPPNQDW